jgi:myo-inositol 2-dehydrogenase / D-chiro-inositol 1-dehydrogenase
VDQARIRVAIIGAGQWGREHARAFTARPEVELSAICSRSPERAGARSGEFGGRPYTDIEDMLDAEEPDLVAVCLPNESHFESTLRVIRAGYPLLVEKPLVFNLAEADILLAEAAARGLFFAINFNHRYARPVRLAVEAIRTGRLGQPIFATWRFGGEPGTSAHAHANLIETQCHGFDLLEHLCGPVASVMAEMTDQTGRGWSTTAIAPRFASGAVGSVVGTYDSSYAYPGTQMLEINGTAGRILIEDTVRRYAYSAAGSEMCEVWQAGYFNDADRAFYCTIDRHLEDLLAAFVQGKRPPVPAAAGRRALMLPQAAINSFESGIRVAIEPEQGLA